MKIGIIGAGNIGATLASKLATAGHEIKLANSKGADSVRETAMKVGAAAVSKEDAVKDVEVVILSIPFAKNADLSGLFEDVPSDVVIIDTSNYYPFRDGAISGVDEGEAESVWVSGKIGRPVVKAWNAVMAETLANRGKPHGEPRRLAIPVAGDDPAAKSVAMGLVELTGLDALDAGGLADSWRQQPGTPAYCTELTADELKAALNAAVRSRAPRNRDVLIEEFMAKGGTLTHEAAIRRNREVTT
jgi:8-hydroxy-5-deazaflavin:NADPH oxidoreductase